MLGLLTNTTFWAGSASLSSASLRLFGRAGREGEAPPGSWWTHPLPLAGLCVGTLFNLSLAIDLGYTAPRDVMQDVVSAEQLRKGGSPYPTEATRLIRDDLERERVASPLGRWWPKVGEMERLALESTISSSWVQAHPPFMALCFVPLVALFSVHGVYVFVTLVSLICLVATLEAVRRGLELDLSGRARLAVLVAVLGWYPVLSALRNGQSGTILSALIVLGWVELRRGLPTLAGMAIGTAVCLKMYPGLLLLDLAVRRRRAFLAAVLWAVALVGLTCALIGGEAFLAYGRMAREVTSAYGSHPWNLSLLGLALHLLAPVAGAPVARGLYVTVVLVVLGALAYGLTRLPKREERPGRDLDVEYALVVALMPLVSPLSWSHYLPVLILPLGVVAARIEKTGAASGPWLAFLAMVTALSVPEGLLSALFPAGAGFWGGVARLVQSLPTMALMTLSLWLARLLFRRPPSPAAVR